MLDKAYTVQYINNIKKKQKVSTANTLFDNLETNRVFALFTPNTMLDTVYNALTVDDRVLVG